MFKTPAALLRILHLFHRWSGIVLGALVLAWFVSGIIMVFVARPRWSEEERLAALPLLTAGPTQTAHAAWQPPMPPWEAWRALGRADLPEGVSLHRIGERHVYRFQTGDNAWLTVDAENGRRLTAEDFTAEAAVRRALEADAAKAGRHADAANTAGPGSPAPAVTLITRDQWTVPARFDPLRPFYRVDLNDTDGQIFYVSKQTGAIVLDTARAERFWNWLGTTVHWLYITPLRAAPGIWRQIVLWLSFAALLMAISGFWLGIQRLRIRQPYPGGRFSPYRDGWKLWHHWLGLIGGVFLIAWLFSGWISMAPFDLIRSSRLSVEERQWLSGGALGADLLRHPAPPVLPEDVREIRWLRFAGRPLALLQGAKTSQLIALDADEPAFPALSLADIRARAAGLLPQARIRTADWLEEPDSEYFPRRHRAPTLPVVRIRFDDANGTAYYIDPANGNIVRKIDAPGRRYRWLFGALHRFDFPPLDFWENGRIALILVTSAIGIALCIGAGVLAWKRFRR